jgi:hypothetical protein
MVIVTESYRIRHSVVARTVGNRIRATQIHAGNASLIPTYSFFIFHSAFFLSSPFSLFLHSISVLPCATPQFAALTLPDL